MREVQVVFGIGENEAEGGDESEDYVGANQWIRPWFKFGPVSVFSSPTFVQSFCRMNIELACNMEGIVP
jgi:hypothetical protein